MPQCQSVTRVVIIDCGPCFPRPLREDDCNVSCGRNQKEAGSRGRGTGIQDIVLAQARLHGTVATPLFAACDEHMTSAAFAFMCRAEAAAVAGDRRAWCGLQSAATAGSRAAHAHCFYDVLTELFIRSGDCLFDRVEHAVTILPVPGKDGRCTRFQRAHDRVGEAFGV